MNAYLVTGYFDNGSKEFNINPYVPKEFVGIRETCIELEGFAYPVVAENAKVALILFALMDCYELDEQHKEEIKKLL